MDPERIADIVDDLEREGFIVVETELDDGWGTTMFFELPGASATTAKTEVDRLVGIAAARGWKAGVTLGWLSTEPDVWEISLMFDRKLQSGRRRPLFTLVP